ncbi:hypothetical protein HA402_000749 [Bradysia odoriphaga]|nr:hypothetical protein HA402_000749 [Bradysia odoriphaga]
MYRLPRSLAVDFLKIIDARMDGNPCSDVPKTIQFCSVLNFYASGSYQRRVGSDAFACMSQTLVSRCVRAYSFVIATELMDEYIKFPQSLEEIRKLQDDLQATVDFPGAFGFVDGSLIALAALNNQEEHAFLSRKHFHALNTQFVVDFRMRFLSVNARYPGSTHDSLIWRASLVNTHLRQMFHQTGSSWRYFMLADNGYPLQPWLLKPYDTPNTPAEKLYNRKHRKLRSLVERSIGLLKARFRCLLNERKLRYDPLMSGYIIYACSTIHNFMIANNYPVDDLEPIYEDLENDFDEDNDDLDISTAELQRGSELRNEISRYFISN